MCDNRIENKCLITNSVCPWVYWCDKIQVWKELSKAPKNCPIKSEAPMPKGYYKVEFERKGYLYILIDDQLIKLVNPYNDKIPKMVKLYKSKNVWKIRKE